MLHKILIALILYSGTCYAACPEKWRPALLQLRNEIRAQTAAGNTQRALDLEREASRIEKECRAILLDRLPADLNEKVAAILDHSGHHPRISYFSQVSQGFKESVENYQARLENRMREDFKKGVLSLDDAVSNAAAADLPGLMKELIQQGASITTHRPFNFDRRDNTLSVMLTPLSIAARFGSIEVFELLVQTLIAQGEIVTHQNRYGTLTSYLRSFIYSPPQFDEAKKIEMLFMAIDRGQIEILEAMQRLGFATFKETPDSHLSFRYRVYGKNVLMHAAYTCQLKVIKYFHEKKNLPLSMSNRGNENLLHYLVSEFRLFPFLKFDPILQYLLQSQEGRSLFAARDCLGRTPLQLAIFSHSSEAAAWFAKYFPESLQEKWGDEGMSILELALEYFPSGRDSSAAEEILKSGNYRASREEIERIRSRWSDYPMEVQGLLTNYGVTN